MRTDQAVNGKEETVPLCKDSGQGDFFEQRSKSDACGGTAEDVIALT